MRAVILVCLVALLAGNGLVMLGAGPWWYQTVPGVLLTGPYNAHFVRDIGMAYLTCAGALIWWLLRPGAGYSAAVTATVFLALHAVVHLFDASCGSSFGHDVARDFAGVFLPPLILAALLTGGRRLGSSPS